VELRDDVERSTYPMPLTATAKYDVEVSHKSQRSDRPIVSHIHPSHRSTQVGRIRQSLVFGKKGLDLFVCGDQLLRGAASNAVLIAEAILFPER
jgi:aspartate-semialdehyde dehydrogenase